MKNFISNMCSNATQAYGQTIGRACRRKLWVLSIMILCIPSLLLLTSCDETPPPTEDTTPPKLILEQSTFGALPGWSKDNLTQLAPAFTRSCARIIKWDATKPFGALEQAGTYKDWQDICARFLALEPKTNLTLRIFFTQNFTPHQIFSNEEKSGLFTGYYEAALKGSRTKSGPYIHPLYHRPDDLIMVQLGDFRDDLKGRRIAGRVQGGKLKPYENRADIVQGAWPHNDKVLVWVDNAVDAFFVQIQGSGIVTLTDGTTMRVGYAGQNGHPYYAIGRELIKRGYVAKENMSMQTIREWLTLNPYEADEIMNTNKSYVFFRELTGAGPLGGEGVALTAERSLAIDRSLLSYGLPLWLALDDAEEDKDTAPPWQHLMIAQDTGGAIRGAVRGDIFWGHGQKAEYYAGHMKRKGSYWALLPKNLDKITDKAP